MSHFTKKKANLAVDGIDGLQLNNRKLQARHQSSSKKHQEFPLDIHRSTELANYYLGFDGWHSSITELKMTELSFNENARTYKCIIEASVTITFQNNRQVESTATSATEDCSDKYLALNFARKAAVTEARKVAFEKLQIVVIGDKVYLLFKDE